MYSELTMRLVDDRDSSSHQNVSGSPSHYLAIYSALCAAFGGLLFGYDIGKIKRVITVFYQIKQHNV